LTAPHVPDVTVYVRAAQRRRAPVVRVRDAGC